jgi:hypothetical protein
MFQIKKQEKTREKALFDLFQRFILYKLATESLNDKRKFDFDTNEIYNAVLVEVSQYLTSQAEFATLALKYLSFSSKPSQDVLSLKDRIFNSNFATFNGRVVKPILPY